MAEKPTADQDARPASDRVKPASRARRTRLEEALRENLRRRKEQARARGNATPPGAAPPRR